MKRWAEEIGGDAEAGPILDRFNQWVEEEREVGEAAYGLQLAAEEILTNLLKYAGGGGNGLCIRMECGSGAGGEWYLQFEDNGLAFNPVEASAAVKADAPLADREIGGLGLHLVRQMASGMEYERVSGWNHLVIRFRGKEEEAR